MHPNYSEFLKFLLESEHYNEYYKYGNLTQCEYCKRTENTVDMFDMGQKQNINEYSTEEILSDFLNNF